MLSQLFPARGVIRVQQRCQRFSTKHPLKSPGSEPRARSRLGHLNRRLPHFLQRYTTPLLNAPLTHVTSFLILHEITAVVPLFALFGVFHYSGWMPSFSVQRNGDGESDNMTGAFDEGVRKFGKWLRKRGWVDEEGGEQLGETGEQVYKRTPGRGTDLILKFAGAYAITKALLPVRIAGSVAATPWFARSILVPVREWMSRLYRMVRRR